MASSISHNGSSSKTWEEMDRDERTGALEMLVYDYASQVEHFARSGKVKDYCSVGNDTNPLLWMCRDKRCAKLFTEKNDRWIYLLLADAAGVLLIHNTSTGSYAHTVSMRQMANDTTTTRLFLDALQRLIAEHVDRKEKHLESAKKLRDSVNSGRTVLGI